MQVAWGVWIRDCREPARKIIVKRYASQRLLKMSFGGLLESAPEPESSEILEDRAEANLVCLSVLT